MVATSKNRYDTRSHRYVADLTKLGACYEANYRRLIKLIPEQSGWDEVSYKLGRSSDLFGVVKISLLESTKYTNTLLLEQVHNTGRWLNNPQITVRLYHDASVAEVISCYRHRRIEAVNAYPNRFMHHPDEKVQINAFLAEWLSFCLQFGASHFEIPTKM